QIPRGAMVCQRRHPGRRRIAAPWPALPHSRALALPWAPMRPRAILFDYGGTLDGPASHWLPRFLQLYRDAGVALTFERFRGAFDHATRCGYGDPIVATFDLQAL